jgi:FAD/FMN-containing dehydrogenase
MSQRTGARSDDALVRALADVVGAAHVLTDADVTAPYETDWTRRWSGRARCVVRPCDTTEAAAVVGVCAEHDAPIVAQGGNTGLVGGSVPRGGEVVVSLRRLDELGPVDWLAGQVTAGAGVTLARLQAHARAAGLAYGVDLAARDSATLGGTIATNAGGIHVVAYGPTRAQVVGVEAVLADGSVLSRLGGLVKDAAGYDLPGLLVGSEGTLAIVTRARVRLVTPPAARVVALLAVDDIGAAADVAGRLRAHLDGITALEYLERSGLELVAAHGDVRVPFAHPPPACLLVEVAGRQPPTAALAELVTASPDVRDAAVADDATGRARLWRVREGLTEAIAGAGRARKLDVAVPLDRLDGFRRRLDEVVATTAPGTQVIVFGHLAEGNLHVNLLRPGHGTRPGVSPDGEAETARAGGLQCGGEPASGGSGSEAVEDLEQAVLELVANVGGSISAEHGIGQHKVDWLHLVRDATDRAAMAAVKRALDPAGRLNPGVLFPRR